MATILSAQCTDERVNAVTADLFHDHPDATSIAALTQDQLESYIRTCGLFRNKARNILATARIIDDAYGGRVPGDREALVALPGVGRKTANVVLAGAFGRAAIAVDTHVARVSTRLGLSDGGTPRAIEEDLMAVLPRDAWAPTHHRLIFHGRRVCKARRPRCDMCPLTRWCAAYRRGDVGR